MASRSAHAALSSLEEPRVLADSEDVKLSSERNDALSAATRPRDAGAVVVNRAHRVRAALASLSSVRRRGPIGTATRVQPGLRALRKRVKGCPSLLLAPRFRANTCKRSANCFHHARAPARRCLHVEAMAAAQRPDRRRAGSRQPLEPLTFVNAHAPLPALHSGMAAVLYRCPYTGVMAQAFIADDVTAMAPGRGIVACGGLDAGQQGRERRSFDR